MKISKSSKALYIVISILVAVVLWLYVDNLGATERTVRLYNVPVTFVGAEDELSDRGLMILSGEDTTIDLRLQGRRSVISKLNRDNVTIQVDVSSISTVGQQTLPYTVAYPNTVSPSSVNVASASVYAVTIDVGELHSKTVSVTTDISGSVADGYMLRECICTPSVITVSGTAEAVASVDHALVTVVLDNVSQSYSEYHAYKLIDAAGNVIDTKKLRCSEDQVRVEIPVVTLKELPLDVKFLESNGSAENNMSYSIEPESISVSGEEDTLSKIDSIQLAEIDLSQVLGDDTLTYEIPLPNGCENESGTSRATVTIKFKNMATQTVACSNISFTNVPDGYHATAVTQSLDVTLRGKSESLEKVTGQNVRIVADLSDMTSASGAYTVKVKVYVDGTTDVGAIGTYQIGYTLKKN